MNIDKLRAKLVEQRLNISTVAKIADMSPTTLYRKMRKPENLTIGDALMFKSILGLTDEEATEIFFGRGEE